MENVWSIDGIILPSHYLCISVGKGSSFVHWPFTHTALGLFLSSWLPGYLKMIAGNGLTQNLCLWPPFLEQWGATPFNLIGQLGTPPANGGFWVLDFTMYHCAHQHVLVGDEGGHDTTFSPLTPLCAWFWDVVIQGHGVSSHVPQNFLQCPFCLWLICPPSAFLPVPSLYEPLPKSFDCKSVPQSRLVISSFNHPLPSGSSWGS